MTRSTSSYDALDALGRVRLSRRFFMRDFLYSEIAAWHGMRNVPIDADSAIEVGRCLCEELLEPLEATFGRIHVRSGYRSPAVNRFGNENKLNCASNEANYAGHIWDYADSGGKRGATACIIVPWLVDRIERGGSWAEMAWWIHDQLPYHRLYFFPKFAAFNISWHEVPVRRIDSYAPPKGCLTRPGMPNHGGSHADQYPLVPELVREGSKGIASRSLSRGVSGSPPAAEVEDDAGAADGRAPTVAPAGVATAPGTAAGERMTATAIAPAGRRAPKQGPEPTRFSTSTSGAIKYRAIHTKNLWRKVNHHKTLEAAINGKDGAVGLFARKVRIDYQVHGDPLYVLAWEQGASHGYAIKAEPAAANGIRVVQVPMADLRRFDGVGQASARELEAYFAR